MLDTALETGLKLMVYGAVEIGLEQGGAVCDACVDGVEDEGHFERGARSGV